LYWNEECRLSLDPAFPSHVRVTDPALIKGEETIACSNGIAKKAENFMKAIPTYIKHLGGRITYRKQRMKFPVFRLLFPLVARRNKLEKGQSTPRNRGKR